MGILCKSVSVSKGKVKNEIRERTMARRVKVVGGPSARSVFRVPRSPEKWSNRDPYRTRPQDCSNNNSVAARRGGGVSGS